jgi:hypothetical protein
MKPIISKQLQLLGAIVVCSAATPALASTVMYTTSLQGGNMCTSCGPFGTVSVTDVAGHPNELSVSLTLQPKEVFASTGAGAALLFDISGNPALSVMSLLPTGFSFHQQTTHADGSGNWNSFIECDVCGSGTSPPQSSGPISFILSVSSGTLAPSSFVTNNNGFLFASDIGVPNGSGGFFTGDVVTSGPLTPVPLPGAAWLLISGMGALGALRRVRQIA